MILKHLENYTFYLLWFNASQLKSKAENGEVLAGHPGEEYSDEVTSPEIQGWLFFSSLLKTSSTVQAVKFCVIPATESNSINQGSVGCSSLGGMCLSGVSHSPSPDWGPVKSAHQGDLPSPQCSS